MMEIEDGSVFEVSREYRPTGRMRWLETVFSGRRTLQQEFVVTVTYNDGGIKEPYTDWVAVQVEYE